MRLTLTLRALGGREEFTVPLTYNEFVQAAIYNMLPPDFSSFLHNTGYIFAKRVFRFFTFSRLLGRYELLRDRGCIRFRGPVRLVVVSPLQEMVDAIHGRLLREGTLRLGVEMLELTEVASAVQTVEDSHLWVHTLSPITVYSTMLRPDGRKYTVYFDPHESAFSEAIRENLRRKLMVARDALGATVDVPLDPLDFEILPVGRIQKSVVTYKGVSVQAFSGRFQLQGPPAILSWALEFGLGSKNSQGFGCIEPLPRQVRREGGRIRAHRTAYPLG